MDCLSLDIGTNTGWAYNQGGSFFAGSWKLATAKEVTTWNKVRLNRRRDPRIERLCKHVGALGIFDVIVFEDVQFASTTYQCQLWAGLRSSAWICGLAQHFEAVPVGTLKKFATGHGSADKAAMSRALKSQHPKLWKAEYSDDAIDAIWLHLWCQKNLQRIFVPPKDIGPHHD